VFSRVQLWTLAAVSLALAYGIGIYYIVLYVPLLTVMALLEGFFVFAYNLEWFGGRFHTDRWFAFSWGLLPVLSGYIIQTNSLSLAALVLAASMALISLVEITASRPYKELKRRLPALGEEEKALMARYERILQYTSSSVILLGAGLLIGRLTG
jgi:voltage-gated potassium channel Kch